MMKSVIRLAAAFSGLFGAFAATTLATPQDARPTFRSATQRVALNVVVKDSHGRPLMGLSGKDFHVLDNGHQAVISDFVADDEPIRLAILIDTSGSMAVGQRMESARQTSHLLMSRLRPGVDSVGIFTFDRKLHEVAPFGSDFRALESGLTKIVPFGQTSLRDAIAAAARRLGEDASPRRAVIVISDGLDTSSALSLGEVSRVASGIDVPVYVLAVTTSADAAASDETTDLAAPVAEIETLARRTGGASLPAVTPAEMSASVHEVLADLRSSYLVAFEPREVPGWHQLTVTVSRESARVRTRTGFWIGDTPMTSRLP